MQLVIAALALSAVAFADDTFEVRYASILNISDSVINVTNTGATVASGGSQPICANVYTFDPAKEFVSFCAGSVTPKALQSISVRGSLSSNPLTPAIPRMVKILKAFENVEPAVMDSRH